MNSFFKILSKDLKITFECGDTRTEITVSPALLLKVVGKIQRILSQLGANCTIDDIIVIGRAIWEMIKPEEEGKEDVKGC